MAQCWSGPCWPCVCWRGCESGGARGGWGGGVYWDPCVPGRIGGVALERQVLRGVMGVEGVDGVEGCGGCLDVM